MKRVRNVFVCLMLLLFLFAGFSLYKMFDYVNHVVKLTPKDDIKVIEVNKTYNIEDFFLIENEENTKGRRIGFYWKDPSGSLEKAAVRLDENGNFTVLAGTGSLVISITDTNSYPAELRDASVTVYVGS